MILTIHLKPNAKTSKLISESAKEMTVALHAPATEGKANAALVVFLADHFNVAKSCITIKRGLASKTKQVEVLLS